MLAAFFIIINAEVFTQSVNKNSSNDGLSSKLWYGGGVGLGLSDNTFNFGLSPMVGYKFTDRFSAGIRIPLEHSHFKLSTTNGEALNYNNLDFGLGAFSRYKLSKNIFAHAEYQKLWIKQPVTSGSFLLLDPENSAMILTENLIENQFNLGLGYTNGIGRWGYEISLLYNVLEETNSLKIPWSVRAGMNYKF